MLGTDGYRITVPNQACAEETLADVDLPVIANAVSERNSDNWSMPTPSAFEGVEIDAFMKWFGAGGRLLLSPTTYPSQVPPANLVSG